VLAPAALALEPGALAALAAPRVAALVAGNCVAALALNFSVVWLVSQESGPLTLTLAGIVKDIALIASSIFLFGNPVTPQQVGGYALALYGLNAYHRFKAAPADAQPPLPALLFSAATDRVFAVMMAGIFGLWLASTAPR
jgi:hypothetical protein